MINPSFFLLAALLPIASGAQGEAIFANPVEDKTYNFPTSRESAILARRILHLTPLGTLSTIFPSSSAPLPSENRPAHLEGLPIGLTDYIADCENSSPTLLAINIATSFKNAFTPHANLSLSLQWTSPTTYSPASLPRFSLLGYLEKIPLDEVESLDLATCFTKKHPDAKWWLPGNQIHRSEWTRLVVREIYWVGGFGDRAYIGWIPREEWESVTKEEWESVRLPGEEKKGKSWVERFGLRSWKNWGFGEFDNAYLEM